MPKELEQKLAKMATKKKLKGKRKDAYIWGTMAKIKKAKGGSW